MKYAELKQRYPERLKVWIARSNERAKASGKLRDWHLKRTFGISLEQFNGMLVAQGMKCAICGASSTAKGQSFHVDHDHLTKRIRGLLCHNCNRGIGYLRDNPAIVESALAYLKQ